MARKSIAVLALLTLGFPALAQDAGGVRLAPGANGGPVGLARPLPFTRTFVTARDVQGGMTGADHQAQNQAMISKLRGDPGFLSGFSFGTPLAASRQVPVLPDDGGYRFRHQHGHGDGPVIINNEGPLAVTVGNGNLVQQQSSTGPGPAAQQQVATTSAGVPLAGRTQGGGTQGGGALNLVTTGGNIIQRSPAGN
jgi:hypothetical protein